MALGLDALWRLETLGASSSSGPTAGVGGREVPAGTNADLEQYYESVSTAEARQELLNYFVHLKEAGDLSAKAVCEICWWVGRSFDAKLTCSLGELARRPGLQSGKYSEHYDNYFGWQAY